MFTHGTVSHSFDRETIWTSPEVSTVVETQVTYQTVYLLFNQTIVLLFCVVVLKTVYPTAAGKIASHGPYTTVKDIYKIDGLTANDIAVFKKYDKFFTVNPPGRAFAERINARVST
jgi:hypothetical protein